MAEQSLYVIARVVARPAEASKVHARFVDLIEPTRREPGCLRYELFVDEGRPGSFIFVQGYESEGAFESHLESKHIREMLPIVLPLLESPPEIRRFRKLG